MITLPQGDFAGGIPAPDFESVWTPCNSMQSVLITHNLSSYELLVQCYIAPAASYINCYELSGDRGGDLLVVKFDSHNSVRLYNNYGSVRYLKIKLWLIGTLVAPTTLWTDVAGKARAMKALDLNAQLITAVLDPVNNQDAATKKYVDDNDVAGYIEGTDYIKFGNTLICWETITILVNGAEAIDTWTYPHAFKAATVPIVTATINSASSYWTRWSVAANIPGVSSCQICIRELDAVGRNYEYEVGCLAIGVWQ